MGRPAQLDGGDDADRAARLLDDGDTTNRADLRRLSHMLKSERGGRTSDDATLFMIEWRGGAADHLAVLD